MGEAERAQAVGDADASRELYSRAAEAEAQAYANTPPDKPITQGVLGLSSVALYREAHRDDAASKQAYTVSAAGGIPEDAEFEIELLLTSSGRSGSRVCIQICRVAMGSARWSRRIWRRRSETVALKIDQVQRLAWRVLR